MQKQSLFGAAILIGALLCSLAMGQSTNYIQNPSFESGSAYSVDDWGSNSYMERVSSVRREGFGSNYSLRVYGDTEGGVMISQATDTPSPLSANTTYVLGGWVKGELNGVNETVRLRYAQLSGSYPNWTSTEVRDTCDWTYISREFTTPSDHTAGRVDLLWNMDSGQAWVDDLSLRESGSPTPITLFCTANPSAIPANGESSSDIVAWVCDGNGNVLIDDTRTVTFTENGPGSLVGITGVPADRGKATITLASSTSSGTNTVQASASGATSDTVDVEMIAIGSPTQVIVSGSPQNVPAGIGETTVTARICDSNGFTCYWRSDSVSFNVTSGGGTLVGSNPVTAVDGMASITLQAGASSGSANVSASASGLTTGNTTVYYTAAKVFSVDAGESYNQHRRGNDMYWLKKWSNASASWNFGWTDDFIGRLQQVGFSDKQRTDVNHTRFCRRTGGGELQLWFPSDTDRDPITADESSIESLISGMKSWSWNAGGNPHVLLSMGMSKQLSRNSSADDFDRYYPEYWSEYEECMYQLLKFLNVTADCRVLMWEFAPEPDRLSGYYDENDNLVTSAGSQEMWDIFWDRYTHIAAAFDRFSADYPDIPVKLCGPGLTSCGAWTTPFNWQQRFIQYCGQQNVRCDMVTFHAYGGHSAVGARDNWDPYPRLDSMLADTQSWIDTYMPGTPIWVSESGFENWIYSPSAWDKNPGNVYASWLPSLWYEILDLDVQEYAHLTMCDSYEDGDNWWPWSSFFTSVQHGGITKSIYNTLLMMTRMANHRVAVTGGDTAMQMIAAKDSDRVTVLCWNSDYDIPNNQTRTLDRGVDISVSELPFNGPVTMEKYLIDPQTSNAYYLEQQGLPFNGDEELQRVAKVDSIPVVDGTVTLDRTLLPADSIMMVVLTPGTDDTPPSGTTASSPLYADDPVFTVSIGGGSDGGSGLSGEYDIYVKEEHRGDWKPLKTNWLGNSFDFCGEPGASYYFGAVAHDNAGNVGTGYQGGKYDCGETRTTVRLGTPDTSSLSRGWYFDSAGDQEGWNWATGTQHSLTGNGCLTAFGNGTGHITNDNNLNIDASSYNRIVLRCSLSGSSRSMSVGFRREGSSTWYNTSTQSSSSSMQYMVFDPTSTGQWYGTIDGLRINGTFSDKLLKVDEVRVVDNNTRQLIVTSSEDTIGDGYPTTATITASICDLEGNTITSANNTVTFTLNGVGALQGTNPVAASGGQAQITLTSSSQSGGIAGITASGSGMIQGATEVTIVSSTDTQGPTTPLQLQSNIEGEMTVSFTWDRSWDNVGVASYKLLRNGVEAATVTHVDGQVTYSATDTTLTPGVSYTYTVKAYDAAGNPSGDSNGCVVQTVPKLPLMWLHRDIGNVGTQGDADFTSADTASFDVAASGTEIWGTADEFHYVYMPLNGDGEIIAEVSSIEYTSDYAKAGLMIRESLDADSAHGYVCLMRQWDYTTDFIYRTNNGGTSAQTYGTYWAGIPRWLKLTRAGNTITAYDSADGVTWNTIGSQSFSMPQEVYIGLASTSAIHDILGNTTYDYVSIKDNPDVNFDSYLNMSDLFHLCNGWLTEAAGLLGDIDHDNAVDLYDYFAFVQSYLGGAAGPDDTEAPSQPTGLSVGSPTSQTLTLSWNDSTDNVDVEGYRVYRNGSYVSSTPDTTFTDTGLTVNQQYTYQVSAYDTATPANESALSSPAVGSTEDTDDPDVPTGLSVGTVTASSVALSWSAAGDNVETTGYRVFRNSGSVGTTGTTAYTDTGLSSETTYSYRVTAFDAAGNESGQSSQVTATTEATSNLLTNGSFEDDMNGWGGPHKEPGATSDGEIDSTGANAHSGTNSFKAVGGSSYAYIDQSSPSLSGGTNYTLSAWVKTNTSGANGMQMRYIEWYGTSGQSIHSSAWESGNQGWTQLSVTISTQSDWTGGRVDLLWEFDSGEGWYDDVVLSEN